MNAFSTVFGTVVIPVHCCLSCAFAFSTVLGWALYGTRCVQYMFGTKAIKVYQILFAVVVVVGCVSPIDAVWDIADTFNGLMAIPNFVALFALSGVVAKLTRDHFADPANRIKSRS